MNGNLHNEWARLFLHALHDAGVRELVLSPGSRSTPLALAAEATAGLRVTPCVDERSAAFFALGQARVTGRPSVLLCTSGSAGAHYLPAVLEADRAHLPLIALTADRPWELTQAHENQTLDQTKLFSSHVRDFFELGEPDPSALFAVARIAAQAVLRSQFPVGGPVHVNARFRKPLEPVDGPADEPWRAELLRCMSRSAPRMFPGRVLPSPAAVERITELCASAQRGLVLAGPAWGSPGRSRGCASADLRQALAGFLRTSAFACGAEATSDLLHGPELSGLCAGAVDAWLERLFADAPPDVVLSIGAPLTSAAWPRIARTHALPALIVVAPHDVADPSGMATDAVVGDAAELLVALSKRLDKLPTDAAYRERVLSLATAVQLAPNSEALSEPGIAHQVVSALPEGATLLVGNSQVVRDVERFAARRNLPLSVLHQRGVSGIDGLIAGAAGTRSVVDSERAVVALLGDVSALHDVGSLSLAAQCDAALVVVVINNGGGRIFEQLPIAGKIPERSLSRLFLTPPADFLAGACGAFQITHVRVDTTQTLTDALERALHTAQTTVIEAVPALASTRAVRFAAASTPTAGAP
jgi:2-succinyl-5-enolpyruvyl-6-hydroxy-3-cyclohexene-1-carboxylate synthase